MRPRKSSLLQKKCFSLGFGLFLIGIIVALLAGAIYVGKEITRLIVEADRSALANTRLMVLEHKMGLRLVHVADTKSSSSATSHGTGYPQK